MSLCFCDQQLFLGKQIMVREGRAWCYIPVIAALGKLRQEAPKFQTSLSYVDPFYRSNRKEGPGKIVQRIKVLAAKADELRSNPRTHTVERINLSKLSFDVYRCAVTCTPTVNKCSEFK